MIEESYRAYCRVKKKIVDAFVHPPGAPDGLDPLRATTLCDTLASLHTIMDRLNPKESSPCSIAPWGSVIHSPPLHVELQLLIE
jgi:hypothetical protein